MSMLKMKLKHTKNLLNIFSIMSSSDLNPLMGQLFSRVSKIWQTLTSSKKRAAIVVTAFALAVLGALFTSCGVTKTIVRTSGKGTTNAQVSVTTNNPTSVSVETQVDSIPVKISSSKRK